jgi:hypothetical protein
METENLTRLLLSIGRISKFGDAFSNASTGPFFGLFSATRLSLVEGLGRKVGVEFSFAGD